MKRMIALALCLVMVLGLFTGVVGAEEPSTNFVKLYQFPSTYLTNDRIKDIGGEPEYYQQIFLCNDSSDSTQDTPLNNASAIVFTETNGDAGFFGRIKVGTDDNGNDIHEWGWDTTNATPGATATLSVTVDGVTYTYPGTFRISGTPDNLPIGDPVTDYMDPLSDSWSFGTVEWAPAGQEPQIYHIVLSSDYNTNPGANLDPLRSNGIPYENIRREHYVVDFCTYNSELQEYFRVDTNTSNAILEDKFEGALSISIAPTKTQIGAHVAAYMPKITDGPAGWPASRTAEWDSFCGGHFYILVEGQRKGSAKKEILSYATDAAFPIHVKQQEFNTLQDLQEYLDDSENEQAYPNYQLQAILTEDVSGHLVIDEKWQNLLLIGADPEGGTVEFNGVIEFDGARMFNFGAWNLAFQGAGKDVEEWDSTNDVPNYAIFGTSGGYYENCTFEDYYHAIHMGEECTKAIIGGFGSTFTNNHVAMYIDYITEEGGSPQCMNSSFIGNDTAIQIEQMPKGGFFNMGSLTFTRNQFINNETDAQNETDQVLWMPMNYFVHDVNIDQGEDIDNSENKRTPALKGTINSKNKEVESIIAGPIAWDTNFYNEEYYFTKKTTIRNDIARMYDVERGFNDMKKLADPIALISEEAAAAETLILDSVMDDQWVASMEITTPAATETPAVYSPRMLLRRVPAKPQFIMQRGEIEPGVIAVDLPCIAADATGEGQTWVDESWISVEVTAGRDTDNKTVVSSVSRGIVTFTLKPGYTDGDGTRAFYYIRSTAQASVEADDDTITVTVTGEPDDGSTFTVKVPEDWKGETVIVTAPDGTEVEVKVAEDGTVTFDVDQEGEYTLEKKKSGLSGLIGAIVGALGGIGNDMDFTDVAKNAWYHDDVAWAYNEGLMDGTGNGKFSPDMATSRAMIVTILWRLEGSPMGVEQSDFSDVVRSSWYGYAVDWAAAFGIVEGYDGKFAPNDAITREQLAAILYRYAKYKGYDVVNTRTDLGSFTDADKVSDWALAPMQWAVGNGLINGTNDALNCGGTATRAQTAAILHRFFG